MNIMKDPNPITAISWEDDTVLRVEENGVIKIQPYEETGEMAMVLWFMVTYEDGTENRYNGKYVAAVSYK